MTEISQTAKSEVKRRNPRRSGPVIKALVDFIDVRIELLKATNFTALKRCCPRIHSYVHPLNAGPGGAATQFEIRIQDPSHYAEVEKVLKVISDEYGLNEDATMTVGLEISLDFWGIPEQDRAKFLGDLAQGYKTPAIEDGGAPMWARGETSVYDSSKPVSALAHGCTLYSTPHREDPEAYGSKAKLYPRKVRVYIKTENNCSPLPKDQHRCRFENTFTDEIFGPTGLDELREFRFEKLAKFYRFQVIGEEPSRYLTALADIGVYYGAPVNKPRAKGRRPAKYREGLKASPLNGRIRSALTNLSRKWSTEPVRRFGSSRVAKSSIPRGIAVSP